MSGYPFEDDWFTGADGREHRAPVTAAMLLWRRDSELIVEQLRVTFWRRFGYEAERFARVAREPAEPFSEEALAMAPPVFPNPLSMDEDMLILEAIAEHTAAERLAEDDLGETVVDWLETAWDARLNGAGEERCHALFQKSAGLVLDPMTLPRLRGLLREGREAWQARQVELQYSALLLDVLPVAVAGDGPVRECFLHWAVGFTEEGAPDLLGLWPAWEKGGPLCKTIADQLRGRGLWQVLAVGAPVSLVAEWGRACTGLNPEWTRRGPRAPVPRERPGPVAALQRDFAGLPGRAPPFCDMETLLDRFFLRALRSMRAWPAIPQLQEA